MLTSPPGRPTPTRSPGGHGAQRARRCALCPGAVRAPLACAPGRRRGCPGGLCPGARTKPACRWSVRAGGATVRGVAGRRRRLVRAVCCPLLQPGINRAAAVNAAVSDSDMALPAAATGHQPCRVPHGGGPFAARSKRPSRKRAGPPVLRGAGIWGCVFRSRCCSTVRCSAAGPDRPVRRGPPS